MSGKCFSMIDQGQRNPKDFYQTPYNMTEFLMSEHLFNFDIPVHEPAAGDLAMVKVLKKYFKNVTYSDKYHKKGIDFLDDETNYNYIITNPPFDLANEFIQHCKDIGTEKFALLMPHNYLHGKKRYDQKLFKNLNFVYVFTRMPILSEELRADDTSASGMQVFAWYVWDKHYYGEPIIRWFDNNNFVGGGK